MTCLSFLVQYDDFSDRLNGKVSKSTIKMSRESRDRRSRSPGSHRVFMGRLPRDARRRDLEDFFKDAGFSKAVKDITLKTGFAFVVRRIHIFLNKKQTCWLQPGCFLILRQIQPVS